MSSVGCAEEAVTDLGAASRPVCASCGAVLRSGNRSRGTCDRCHAASHVPADWNPRCDPSFAGAWLTHLVMNSGRWCHPSTLWPSRDHVQRLQVRQLASEVVAAAERLGLVVERHQALGYRCTGWGELPKYLRLAAPCEECGEVSGQLTIDGGEVG